MRSGRTNFRRLSEAEDTWIFETNLYNLLFFYIIIAFDFKI